MRQQRTTTAPAATATNIVGMLQQAGGGAGYHLSDFPLCVAAACPPPAPPSVGETDKFQGGKMISSSCSLENGVSFSLSP